MDAPRIEEIINAIEDYGDRERHLGKAMASGNDQDAARWNKDADKKLATVRKMLTEGIYP